MDQANNLSPSSLIDRMDQNKREDAITEMVDEMALISDRNRALHEENERLRLELRQAAKAIKDSKDIKKSYDGMLAVFQEIRETISDIYYSAYWYPDRFVDDPDSKWAALRDVLGFPPGQTQEKLGTPRDPIAEERKVIEYMNNALLAIILSPIEKAHGIARKTLDQNGYLQQLINPFEG